MKKLFYLITFSFLITFTLSCEKESEDLKYVTFENTTYKFGVEIDGSSTRQIKVYSSTEMNKDKTFEIKVNTTLSTADPASYIVPTHVTIPAKSNVGVIDVKVSDINIDEGKILVLEFINDNEFYFGKPITLNLKQLCTANEATLFFLFDGYPEETSWELLDGTGSTVDWGDSYDNMATFEKSICLPNGTYTLNVYDAYGDGMYDGSITGNYKLYIGTTIYASGSGNFGSMRSTTFNIP